MIVILSKLVMVNDSLYFRFACGQITGLDEYCVVILAGAINNQCQRLK